uniref:Uncharacterized protein n=1 Tax=Timema poppense TaxID=170557 RepID=A0A7R9DCG1_TIMPO|nr:unnamed protein product [Timema poppensis]
MSSEYAAILLSTVGSSEIVPGKLTDSEVGRGHHITTLLLLTDAQVEDIAKVGLLLVYESISKLSKTAILTFEGEMEARPSFELTELEAPDRFNLPHIDSEIDVILVVALLVAVCSAQWYGDLVSSSAAAAASASVAGHSGGWGGYPGGWGGYPGDWGGNPTLKTQVTTPYNKVWNFKDN